MKSNLMPRPKKVHFSDAVEYHYVKCLDDYTVIERSQIWLTAKDYSRIRLENKVIIDMIDEGLVEEDRQETCYRGLETKATEECKYRRNQKQEAKEAVLYAQEAQHDERQMQLDWEPIREAYISMSSESKTLAEEVGLSDAFNAWRAYQKAPAEDVPKMRRPRPFVQSSPLQHHRSLSHAF